MSEMQPQTLQRIVRTNLRTRREFLGLTQQDVADRVNSKRSENQPQMHAAYISAVEAGDRIPTLAIVAELTEALETTPEVVVSAPEEIFLQAS